ncbi:MAG: hypothetical protein DRN15_04760 [Thermoprotei archaeon]|nr:MAG: hypothetical protein DRN15_04760 [Thermoprotei archaeon]
MEGSTSQAGSVEFDEKSFIINGRRIFIFSGEMHYFRIPKELWRDRILKAKRAFLNTIASYIAWNWHEPSKGILIFSGDRDVERFIKLCGELGLFFIARPGPYICSEWDSGGHPNWIYAEGCLLRSLDPVYMNHVKRWYDVILPIIRRNSAPEGGPVIMLQVENEYFWGNVPFILKLYELARQHVHGIPIVTNENRYVRGTPIIDTIDDYPSPWEITRFEDKIRRLLSEQPDKPPMFMELEGGWFSEFGTKLPTSRGSFPPEWTEILLKTAIGMGINGINIYMFHGGTNPGYFTAKYITTTYDYEAAISEWGELRERYYAIRRVGAFIHFFQDFLLETTPREDYAEVDNPELTLFARCKGDAAIIFIRNMTSRAQQYKVKLRSGEEIPTRIKAFIPPRSMRILFVRYKIPNSSFTLEYSTSEPMMLLDYGRRKVLLLHGALGEKGELRLASDKVIEVTYKPSEVEVRSTEDGRKLVAEYRHEAHESILEARSGSELLQIIITTTERASRSWLAYFRGSPVVLVSDLYFMENYREEDSSLHIDFEVKPCEKPFEMILIADREVKEIIFDGVKAVVERIVDGIYRVKIGPVKIGEGVQAKLSEIWRLRYEPIEVKGEPIKPYTPLELLGVYDNGYVRYTIEFRAPKDLRNKMLFISYFNDFASVILNKKFLGSGYRSIELDASEALKEREYNVLHIILESTGHNNDGLLYILNGITGGIYIDKVKEIELTEWSRLPIPTMWEIIKESPLADIDVSEFLMRPERSRTFMRIMERARGKPEPCTKVSSDGLYEKILSVPPELADAYFILEIEQPQVMLIFVNGKHVGSATWIDRGGRLVVDITDFLQRPGDNRIRILSYDGCKRIMLKIYRYKVEGSWFLYEGTKGLCEEWYKRPSEDWKVIKLPIKHREGPRGSILWIRGKAHVKVKDKIRAPLGLRIEASSRCLIFFNGKLIGRYVPEGPQSKFYIPEPLIKEENDIVLMIQDIGRDPLLQSVDVEPYFIHRTCSMKIEFY